MVWGFSTQYESLIVDGASVSKILYIATIFTAGSMFLLWLGDRISLKGIGNGVSIIIFAGIVGRLPGQISSMWTTMIGTGTRRRAVQRTAELRTLPFLLSADHRVCRIHEPGGTQDPDPVHVKHSSDSSQGYDVPAAEDKFSQRHSGHLRQRADDGSDPDCQLLSGQ